MPKSKEIVTTSDSSDSEVEVKNKKRKKETKKPESKKSKKEDKSSDDEKSWEIGNNRFVEVKEFKGKVYVDVREKYEDKNTSEMKPGKKGIFLTIDQWKKLLDVAEDVNEALSKV